MRKEQKNPQFSATVVRLRIIAATVVFAAGAMAAENPISAAPPAPVASQSAATAPSDEGTPVQPERIRRITLEQVKQSAAPAASPLARLAYLSVEAAKQHRLGVQADYYPKIGAAFANLHYSEFLGQVATFRRPIAGSLVEVPIPLFSRNQTVVAVTLTQPITPILAIRQAVRVARADERIAAAEAAAPVAATARETQVEETYFKLMIAQRRLSSAELKPRSGEDRRLFAGAAVALIASPGPGPEMAEAGKALAAAAAAAEVRELSASLNRIMGWPEDTKLDLVPPGPLVENLSLQEVNDKAVAGNPEVVVAEQTLVKARAASTLSKLAYFPVVAAVGGYMFQNAIPLVPDRFGYGGVIATWNLFDSGKREHAVKEAHAQEEMAQLALQATRAKVAAGIGKSYFDLERSRQLSQVAQKMGSSLTLLMNVNSSAESNDVKAARADVEVEMLEADLAHRQAFARLKALIGERR